jgi:hypothetical protein
MSSTAHRMKDSRELVMMEEPRLNPGGHLLWVRLDYPIPVFPASYLSAHTMLQA